MQHRPLQKLSIIVSFLAGLVFQISPAQADRAEIVARCKAATVMVHVSGYGSGSGFCVSADGFLLSNYHVVASVGVGGFVDVVLGSGDATEKLVKARVINAERENDLALLKAEELKNATHLPLGSIANLVETMPLTTYGFPFGRMLAVEGKTNPSISVNTGRVSSLRKIEGKLRAIQLDAAVNPGNSGGPVIDEKGEVIGVVVSGVRTSRVSFAIPVNIVKEFLNKPGLILDATPIRYRDRITKRRFHIEAFAFRESAKPQSVELVFRNERGVERKIQAIPDGENFFVETTPVANSGVSQKLRATLQSADKNEKIDIADQSIQMGNKEFQLLEVRKIEKRPDLHILVTTDGKKFAGEIAGLDKINSVEGKTVDFTKAERIDIHVYEPGPVQINYAIIASRSDQTISTTYGNIEITHVPQRVSEHPFVIGDPFAPLVDEMTIDTFVDGNSILYVTPSGIAWDHKSGAKPGVPDAQGSYVLVNGLKWYVNWRNPDPASTGPDVSSTYPLKIGHAAWKFKLLSVREKQNDLNTVKRGKVKAKYDDESPEYYVISIDDTPDGGAWYRLQLSREGRTTTKPAPAPKEAISTASRSETTELSGDKLRTRFLKDAAKVKVLSEGKIQVFRKGGQPYANSKPTHLWKSIPAPFVGMSYFQSPSYYGNRLEFEIESPGLVILVTTTRFGGGGSVSASLLAEMDSPEDLKAQGWRSSDVELVAEPGWAVFYRECVKGESFSIRTEKYNPPTVLFPISADGKPTPATPILTESLSAGEVRKLLSSRGAKVNVATRGKVKELREGDRPYHGSKESQIWKPIPKHFAGLKYFQVHSAYQGTINVEVKTDGIVVMAGCHRGAVPKSIAPASRQKLLNEGWIEFEGNLVSHLTWATFYRECKAGEVLTLSTDKYYAPVILLPETTPVTE